MRSRFVPFRSLILWLALTIPSRFPPSFSLLSVIVSARLSRVPCARSRSPKHALPVHLDIAFSDVRTRMYVWWSLATTWLHNLPHAPFARTVRQLDVLEFRFTVKPETQRGTFHDTVSLDETRFLILRTMFTEFRTGLTIFRFPECYYCNMKKHYVTR